MAGEALEKDFEFTYNFRVNDQRIVEAGKNQERLAAQIERATAAQERFAEASERTGRRVAGRGGVADQQLRQNRLIYAERERQEKEAFRTSLRREQEHQREASRWRRQWERDDAREAAAAARSRTREAVAAQRATARQEAAAARSAGQLRDAYNRRVYQRYTAGPSDSSGLGSLGYAGGIAGAAALAAGGLGIAAYNRLDRFGTEAIAAGAEKTSAIRGYTTLLGGNRSQAELEFYRAQQFAQKTDFTNSAIEQAQARLLGQGFRDRGLYSALFSAADLAAIMPGDKNETLNRVTLALGQIKGKGKLQGEELTQQLAEAGLNSGLVKEQIRQAMGLKDIAAVDKKISGGAVSADVAIPAIERAIMAQLGTKAAGEYSTGSAGSVTSLMSNIAEGQKNLAKSFDSELLPAMGLYKDALKDQAQVFDINTKAGKDLSYVYQDLANASVAQKTAMTAFETSFLRVFAETYRVQREAQGNDFALQAARTKDAWEQLGASLGKAGTGAATAAQVLDKLSYQAAKFIDFELNELPKLLLNPVEYLKGARRGEILRDDAHDASDRYGVNNKQSGLPYTYAPPATAKAAAKAALGTDAKKKSRKHDKDYSTPLWHYEPDGAPTSVDGPVALGAPIGVGSAAMAKGGDVYNIGPIQVMSQPGQSAQEIGRMVGEEVVTVLRSLRRVPAATSGAKKG